jgi:hypothetical protein
MNPVPHNPAASYDLAAFAWSAELSIMELAAKTDFEVNISLAREVYYAHEVQYTLWLNSQTDTRPLSELFPADDIVND